LWISTDYTKRENSLLALEKTYDFLSAPENFEVPY
jgi:hypothetical protein